MTDCTQLNILERYLKANGIEYVRTDQEARYTPTGYTILNERHQIKVIGEDGRILWDAICHRGSCGYEHGLLEIRGSLVNTEEDGDTVVGWLTALDVMERIERKIS